MTAWRLVLASVVCAGLSGCTPGISQKVSDYHVGGAVTLVSWTYATGSIEPPANTAAILRALGPQLPPGAGIDLHAGGPLASRRAEIVGRLLGQTVGLLAQGSGRDAAAELVSLQPGRIVSDACLVPGVQYGGGLWPEEDTHAPVLLPPGCALSTAIAAQVTHPEDLLRGQPLPPGAALPYAAAIERYYHRHDGVPESSGPVSAGVAGATSGETAVSATGAVAPSPSSQANPLLGPLPPDQQTLKVPN